MKLDIDRYHRKTRSAKVIQVLETMVLVGEGIEGDMLRVITQYWDFEGRLLAEYDPDLNRNQA